MMRLAKVTVLALALAACGESSARVDAIIEAPSADSDAYPFAAIDTLELSIARAGEDENLALVQGELGDELSLADIAFGSELVVHLSGRASGAEVAYGRSCSFDMEEGQEAIVPRLFFSRVVRWANGPELQLARGAGASSVALSTSSHLLILGGREGGEVELLDLLEGGQESGASELLDLELSPRSGGRVLPMGDGALLVGGEAAPGEAQGSIELVRPLESSDGNRLQRFDGQGLVEHDAVLLQDGSVLVAGGMAELQPGALSLNGGARLYSISGTELVERGLGAEMLIPRRRHEMTRLGNEVGADVLICGGLGADELPVADCELFRPLKGVFEALEGARLQVPRYDHQALRLPGGFLLIIGGLSVDTPAGEPAAVREIELYDPVQGIFEVVGTLPGGAGVTEFSATELPDGRLMMAGGRDLDGLAVSTVLLASFDPINGAVDLLSTDALSQPRAGHSASLLCDGTVLVVGGEAGQSAATERYNPPSAGRR